MGSPERQAGGGQHALPATQGHPSVREIAIRDRIDWRLGCLARLDKLSIGAMTSVEAEGHDRLSDELYELRKELDDWLGEDVVSQIYGGQTEMFATTFATLNCGEVFHA